MDVSKVIEGKISDYFAKKAEQYACAKSSLSILVEISDREKQKALVALYKDKKFLAWVKLDELLNLSMLESLVTSSSKVSKILYDSILKYENEFKTQAQIAIYSNLEYYAMEKYQPKKQITINDII